MCDVQFYLLKSNLNQDTILYLVYIRYHNTDELINRL